MRPPERCWSPATRSSRVVLPAPFGPINAVREPDRTSRLTWSTAFNAPKDLLTSTTFSASGSTATSSRRGSPSAGAPRAPPPPPPPGRHASEAPPPGGPGGGGEGGGGQTNPRGGRGRG